MKEGGTVRTVLLDDRGHVALLKLYLARSGYTSGPLFRAGINGGAARCPTTQHTTGGRSTAPPPAPRSASTSSATRTPPNSTAACPLRSSAASATPPPRPPQVYTLLADKLADTEIRAARRKRETRRRLAVASGDPGLDREQDCLMSHHGRG
jgi:integrase/recombinase XerD